MFLLIVNSAEKSRNTDGRFFIYHDFLSRYSDYVLFWAFFLRAEMCNVVDAWPPNISNNKVLRICEWCSREVSLIYYLYAEILWSFVRLPLNQGRMNRIVPAHNSREEFGKIFFKCLSKVKAKKAELSFPRTNTDPRFNFISFRNIEYKVNR